MEIKTPFVATIVGKPGSGKSHLLKYILYNQQCLDFYERFEIILVFCKTKFNHSYDWVPDEWVHSGYSARAIKNIMRIQASIREQGLEPLPVALIFVDCLDAKLFNSQLFKDLIYNRRHYNISMILTTQYLLGNVSTSQRENSDLVFIFKQFSANSIDGCYNAFGNLYFRDRNEFEQYMKRLDSHKFLMIDTRANQKTVTCCPPDIPDPMIEPLATIPLAQLRSI